MVDRSFTYTDGGNIRLTSMGSQYTGEKIPGELSRMVTFSYDPNRWNSIHFEKLAQYCATLYYTSELARAAVNKPLSYIIGPGLKFRSALSAKYLGLDEGQAREFSDELTYHLDQRKKELGYYRVSREVAKECMITGDAFIHILRTKDGLIKGFAPEPGVTLIANSQTDTRKRLVNGIYVDKTNRPYAFHSLAKDRRIRFRDDYLFVRRTERVHQVRGTGIFYFAISRIKNYDRIWEATMQKMILESMIVGYSDSGGEVQEVLLDRSKNRNTPETSEPTGKSVSIDPGLFLDLQNRSNMKFLTPGTPSGNFGTANDWVLNLLGAGCGYPAQFLVGKYDTAYSASRAALNDVERQLRIDRSMFIEEMEEPINRMLLQDLLLRGDITLPIEGIPLSRWLRGQWVHPRLGHINPKQEAEANKIAVNNGWLMNSDVAEEYGMDYNDNIEEAAKQVIDWRNRTGITSAPVEESTMEEDNED